MVRLGTKGLLGVLPWGRFPQETDRRRGYDRLPLKKGLEPESERETSWRESAWSR
jgi:hypothetical protein